MRGLIRSAIIGLAAALVFAGAAPVRAQDFPQLTGRVVDEAGILPGNVRADLDAKLAALEARNGDQLVVVTLRSLRGETIEQYGVALGRAWQIGQKDKNNGALLIVAPNERKVRIEVGYGLEGTLTDAASKLIIEGTILPRFRAHDIAGGITRGVDDIVRVLSGGSEDLQRRAPAVSPSPIDRVAAALGIPVALAYLLLAVVAVAVCALVGWLFVTLFVRRLVATGALPKRQGGYRRSNRQDPYQSANWTGLSTLPGASGSIGGFGGFGGFSGGGGSFGGGGASGSW